MKGNQHGFVLTETILVLSIFLLLSSITLIMLKPHSIMLEKNMFFTQFKSDLLFAQQYAISHQTPVTVNIIPFQHYYYFSENIGGKVVLERNYSKDVKVVEATFPLYFQFAPDGNISRFGSLHIKINGEIYRMTFQIGKGRFYVTKE